MTLDVLASSGSAPLLPELRAEFDRARAAILKITGQADPVVSVINEKSGEVVYTLRIKGTSYRPKVFSKGAYTIRVGEGKRVKTLKGIRSLEEGKSATLNIAL